jgi:hypothetical protein
MEGNGARGVILGKATREEKSRDTYKVRESWKKCYPVFSDKIWRDTRYMKKRGNLSGHKKSWRYPMDDYQIMKITESLGAK